MKQRVSLITLGVTDFTRSRRFYEAVGWETGASPEDAINPHWTITEAGGIRLN